MKIASVIPQLRTTDLAASIAFYTQALGFTLEFEHKGFYAGVRSGRYMLHLKLVDETDPSIAYVDLGDHIHLYFQTDDIAAVAAELKRKGVKLELDVHATDWNTRECVLKDNQGHTLYFGELL
jgi:catechol 2,3-dioxygenase-like lactoylglutathione lyase family enzyme